MNPTLKPVCCAIAVLAAQSAWSQTAITQTLPTVTVSAEPPYAVKATSSATRTATPVESVPQSVIVVPREMLEDQDVQTVSDALRNVSNVNALDPRDSNIVTFKVRGFSSAMVVDGVTMPGYFANAESLVNVERIDVIKGPAGGLFGSGQGIGTYGSQGGTIAVTTFEPEAVAKRSVGLRAGTYGERGLNFDLNQPLNAEWAVRLSGEVQRSDSESDGVYFKRTALFPSLAWTPSAATKVVLRLRHLDNRTLDYAGLPTDGTLDTSTFTLPRSLNITATGLPETKQTSDGANLQWTQKLSDQWDFSLVAAHNRVLVDERAVFPMPYGRPGSLQALFGARLWDQWKTTTLSPSLTGRFEAGGVRHTLSTGLDYEKTVDDAYMAFSVGPGFFGDLGMVDLSAPVFPAWVEPLAPNPPDQQNRYTSKVFYLQDQMDVGAWHLLGSLRHSRIGITDVNTDPMFGQNNVTKNSTTTPRVGAVFDFSPKVSAFAGYSEGIKVPTGSLFAAPPKPETSVQKELGLRLRDMAGVSATLALFDLKRRNAAVADQTTFLSYQTGEQRSKGLDVDVRWNATSELTWIAAFTHQTARITADEFTPVLVGKRLFNVPERQLRLAARYDIRQGDLAGLGAGLGVTYRDRLPGNNTNTFFTPAATVWDAQLSYQRGKARCALSVRNLFDKQYYQPSTYFGGGQVTPAQPRTVSVSATFDF